MTAVRTSTRSLVAFAAALALLIAVALMSFAASSSVDRASSTWSKHTQASSTWSKHAPAVLASSTWSKSSTWS